MIIIGCPASLQLSHRLLFCYGGVCQGGAVTPCYQVSTSTQNIRQQLVRMSPGPPSPLSRQVFTEICKIDILVIGSNFRDAILVRIS